MRIGIIGACGRMGGNFVREILTDGAFTLAGGTARAGNKNIGRDLGEISGAEKAGVNLTDNNEELVKISDAIIDFSSPESTMAVLKLTAKYKKIHVIGTTGLSDAQKKELENAARETVIIFSPNMSIGVNVLLSITEKVAKILDDSYDIEILEMHHGLKVDAPSGTALGLGKAAAAGRGVNLSDVERRSRDGHTGQRPSGEIGFATLRGGDVVGDHTVIFAGLGERIELTHKASSRAIYAKGALRACLWGAGKKPGLYSMRDVLED